MRNTFETHFRDPAARFARVCLFVTPPKRAWGMPGAQCTRSLVCESGGWNAHEYSQRVHRKRPAFPHAMVLRLIPRSPVTGFLATVIPEKLASQELDTSV